MAPTPPDNQDNIISFLLLRKALGWIAIAMPFVLALGAWWFEGIPWADSVSSYYYTSMRDVFVGTMFAIGVFLFCYRAGNRQDNILTNLAGIGAAAIGLFPMDADYSKVLVERHRDLAGPNCYVPHGFLGYHFYAAAAFFGIISYLVIWRFRRFEQPIVTANKLKRNKVYMTCGVIMLVCFVAIALLKWHLKRASIVIPETGAIVAFAIAWLTKGRTIWPD